MALVCGDIHGHKEKLLAFLKYKPEEEHLLVGDLMDSRRASEEQIIETFRIWVKSGIESCWGNHDIQYLSHCPQELYCSGRSKNPAFMHLITMNKKRFKGCFIRDDYLISHGGLTKKLGSRISMEAAHEWINREVDRLVDTPFIQRPLSMVFDIGSIRGGMANAGGPLWADYRYETLDITKNQVFGHSHKDLMNIISVGKQNARRYHVIVDCDQFWCFNTSTGKGEDFMPEDKKDPAIRRVLERQY